MKKLLFLVAVVLLLTLSATGVRAADIETRYGEILIAPAAYNWIEPYTGNDGSTVEQAANSTLVIRNPNGSDIEIDRTYLLGPDGNIVHTYVAANDPSTM